MLPVRPALSPRSIALVRWVSLKSCVAITGFRSGGGGDATNTLGASPEGFNARVSRTPSPGVPGRWAPQSSCPRPTDRPAQLHDVADHFGHRLVVFRRDCLVDLDRGVQSSR